MTQTMTLFQDTFQREVPAINEAIQAEIAALPPLVRPVAEHVMTAGGKRLRPMLTILFARAMGCRGSHLPGLACALEFMHAATLMHDDILDNADLRRGRPAAHTLFGVTPTILAGDALLALANTIVARTGNTRLTVCISQAIMRTANGEIMEIAAIRDPDITRSLYLEIITGKTAYLMQAACEFGAILAEADQETLERAQTFGLNLGIAFQLVDDALDYSACSSTSGKPLGGDLREGKFTLPLLLYLESLPEAERLALAQELVQANLPLERQEAVVRTVVSQGFAEETRTEAKAYLDLARQALAVIPGSQDKHVLQATLDFILNRNK